MNASIPDTSRVFLQVSLSLSLFLPVCECVIFHCFQHSQKFEGFYDVDLEWDLPELSSIGKAVLHVVFLPEEQSQFAKVSRYLMLIF